MVLYVVGKTKNFNSRQLLITDIQEVQLQNCEDQNVTISTASKVERGLIYTFLGGNTRGLVDYEDIVRLFNAELPKTIGTPSIAKTN